MGMYTKLSHINETIWGQEKERSIDFNPRSIGTHNKKMNPLSN